MSLPAHHTFDDFVVGPANRFAHAAAEAVAEAPSTAYNPLFLHGGAGLGKTHLMHAIGRRVFARNSNADIAYVSAKTFASELIVADANDRTGAFRHRYRHVDVLLFDDIQHLEGDERTQEEFFHTFNARYDARKQIVIASDRPAVEIRTREARLRQRFEWGLSADIRPPDVETRTAILRKQAESEHIAIPADVLTYIATISASNVRALRASLMRVAAFASLTKEPITIELAAAALA